MPFGAARGGSVRSLRSVRALRSAQRGVGSGFRAEPGGGSPSRATILRSVKPVNEVAGRSRRIGRVRCPRVRRGRVRLFATAPAIREAGLFVSPFPLMGWGDKERATSVRRSGPFF